MELNGFERAFSVFLTWNLCRHKTVVSGVPATERGTFGVALGRTLVMSARQSPLAHAALWLLSSSAPVVARLSLLAVQSDHRTVNVLCVRLADCFLVPLCCS